MVDKKPHGWKGNQVPEKICLEQRQKEEKEKPQLYE